MAKHSLAIVGAKGQILKREAGELPIYSLAKPLIASAVIASGIDIHTPIAHWIGAQVCPWGAQITVAQLLNHTSGLTDYGALPAYHQAVQAGEPPWSDDEFIGCTLHQPLLFAPGEGWAYSNPGYWLLTQILQQHTGVSSEAAIKSAVAEPLGLTTLHQQRGQFADDLPSYPAEWVWHGLWIADALDMVTFMRSPLVEPLRQALFKIPFEHPDWQNPHEGYGLMVEPGQRYGHNGEGPGYSAACYRLEASGLTGCLLTSADTDGVAMRQLLALMAPMA